MIQHFQRLFHIKQKKKVDLTIYHLRNPVDGSVQSHAVDAAVKIVHGDTEGVHAFAFINGGVNALIGDASKPEWVVQVKGEERQKKPMALAMTTQQARHYFDIQAIRNDLQPIFDDPDILAKYYAWLCFLRVPVLAEKVHMLPSAAVSTTENGQHHMQFWDPRGNKFTSKLIIEIQNSGIEFVGVSSLNKSGTPELTTEEEGIEYCKDKDIPLFLRGVGRDVAKGSFTILDIGIDGIKVRREGNIPSEYLIPKHLLADHQPKVDPPRFPAYIIPERLFEAYKHNQPMLRRAMLAHLNGDPEDKILQTLKED